MYIDFTNVFTGFIIVVCGIVALFSREQLVRVFGTMGVFLLLLTTTSMNPFFVIVITLALAVHIFSDRFRNIGRYSYVLLALAILLISTPLVEASNHNDPDAGGGLPSVIERVELVEKVLEVEQITKQPTIEVKGTDYVPGDVGKMQVYLAIGQLPITNATCLISALYPNMTYFIEKALMLEATQDDFQGLYYLDFLVPPTTGVYPVNAICEFDTETIDDYVHTVTFDGLVSSDPFENLENDDGITYDIIDQATCNSINCSVNFSITLPAGWYTANINLAKIMLEYSMTKSQDADFYVYSPSNNQSYYWFTGNTKDIPYIEQFDLNSTFQADTEITIIMQGDATFQGNKFAFDYLFIERSYLGTTVNDLRGNEELVVSAGIYEMYQVITSPTDLLSAEQFAHILVILAIIGFMMVGQWFIVGLLTIFYGFTFYDGITTVIIISLASMYILYKAFSRKDNY